MKPRPSLVVKVAAVAAVAAAAVQRQAISFTALNSFLVAVENAVVLYVGATIVLKGQFSVGMLVAFLGYKAQFVSRASSLVDQLLSFKMLGLQMDRLADILLTPPEKRSPLVNARISDDFTPSIELRGVSYRYAQDDPWVLHNVSLKIEAGESVAITGASGCGKTTLLKIMLGQIEPEEGEVLIGGIPLRNLGLQAYRERIGVVMQDDQLFAGTIAENISLFDPRIDHAKIESAAKLAAIHADISRMPMGYHTLVGDMGAALSGGQRQRVVLARALYKDPQFLFLDEATSHLDNATERLINHEVKALAMTRIVIAHRQQTIDAMGRVINLTDM